MGHGAYNEESRTLRAAASGYHTKSANEIFTQRETHREMRALDITIRESRDSEEHPESVPVIIALDVTGSMHQIPHSLIKDGLPTIVAKIMEAGIQHPQILFLAIGDHLTDSAPLQVGQFESSDELMDKWLESTYLEGNGGGNGGESYMLAWYFATNHTVTDAWEKRGQKGVLITIGDEPVHRNITGRGLKRVLGKADISDDIFIESSGLLKEASEKYDVYHIHTKETFNGSRSEVVAGWKEMLGDHLFTVNNHKEIPNLMAELVLKSVNPGNPENVSSDKTSSEKKDSGNSQEILS